MSLNYSWTRVQAFKLPEIRKKYRALWDKIRADSMRLDQLLAVHRGLWTGALYVYIIPREIAEEYRLEIEALKPTIRGRDIKPFGFIWREFYIIYASAKHMPDFPKRFPNIMRWLEKHKLILERRSAVFTWNKEWWELEDPLEPQIFEQKKILSPLFSRQQSFALDISGKYYVLDSTTMIRPWLSDEERELYAKNWKKVNEKDLNIDVFIEEGKKASRELGSWGESLWYVLGLLNSETLEFFFKQYSPRLMKRTKRPKKGRWYSYMPPYLNILPIKMAEQPTRSEVIRYSRTISEKTNKFLALPPDVDPTEKAELESEIGFLVHELNEIIFDIYELNENERIVIQNFVYKKR